MAEASPTGRLRTPFFYGWFLAIGGAVSASFLLGSNQFALGVFLVPMEDDLGWTRSVFFGALSVRYLLAGLLGPLIGPLGDSVRAPRFLLPLGVILLGGSLAAVRWVEHPALFFLIYGVVGAIGSALLHLHVWEAIILKWFSRKRTRALVIANIGEASGPMVFPIAITGLIALFGWRDAWLWYGVITVAVLMPIALLVRTRPEQLGQTLDGLPARAVADEDAAAHATRAGLLHGQHQPATFRGGADAQLLAAGPRVHHHRVLDNRLPVAVDSALQRHRFQRNPRRLRGLRVRGREHCQPRAVGPTGGTLPPAADDDVARDPPQGWESSCC